jgi:hypothetical protein
MKRVVSLVAICLLAATMGVPSSMAMGKAKKAEKPACKCPEGQCVCSKVDAPKTLPCGCATGACKCAPKK